MGRAENRKKAKYIRRKISDEQFKKLQSDINRAYIQDEVEKQLQFVQAFWAECMEEAFKKNNISQTKLKMVLDDIELIMARKVSEKKKNSSGSNPVIKGVK